MVFVVFGLGLIWACGGSGGDVELGKKVFKMQCVACHGSDGNLQLNGAKKLEESTLSFEERKAIITNGKGAMTAFGSILTPEEIEAAAAYTIKQFPQK